MKKGFILGFASAILISGFVMANDMLSEVYTSQFPIKIDGKEYTPEMPILSYQGRTYLPLREFGTATNNKVDFQDNTILIDTKSMYTDESERLIYTTRTGQKYHYDGSCNGGDYFRTTLSDAQKLGLQPCEKCVLKSE